MAQAVYYGVSIADHNDINKVVFIRDTNFSPSNLQPGDILCVYFSQRNDAEGEITLVLHLGDVELDVNTEGDYGNTVYNTSNIAVGPCDWKDGEVVFFSYTKAVNPSRILTNDAYWEMIAKAHATDDVYGDVLLEDDQLNNKVNEEWLDGWDANNDNAAATIGLIKKHMPPEWGYEDETEAPKTRLGYLYTLDNSTTPPAKVEKNVIYAPQIPENVSEFYNDAGYLSNPITVDLVFNGEDSEGSKTLDKQEGESDAIIVIDLDHDPAGPLSGNEDGAVGINGDTYIYGNLNIVADNRINVGEIHAYPEDGVIDVTSPINIGDTIHLNGDTYIGDKPLDDYIKDLFDDDDTGVQSMINDSLADALADYMITKRYYAEVTTGLTQGAIKMIAYGENPTETRTDVDEIIKTNESLHVPGYDVVGVITWEAWHGPSGATNPKNVNIFGIWWQGNDPQSEVVYLKTTALDGSTPAFRTSIDVLYKKSAYTINYDAMGGIGAPDAQHKLYNQTIRISNLVPTKPGATFKGWRTSANSSKIAYQPNDLYTANENRTLYALWSDNGGRLVYETQGVGEMRSQSVQMLYEQAVYAAYGPRVPALRHTFNEWNTDPYGNGQKYMPRDLIKEAYEPPFDLTLYAIWDKKIMAYISYTPYIPEVGSNPSQMKLYEYIQEQSGKYKYVLTEDIAVNPNKEYYKKENTTIYMTYPLETRTPSDIFVADGKMIVGWNTRENGTGTTYPVDWVYKEANVIPEGNATLYAIWDEEKTIVYDPNYAGIGNAAEFVMTYKDAVIVDYNGFERDGWYVDHWNTDSNDASGTEYAFGDIVKESNELPTENIVLYAIWNQPKTLTYKSYTPYEPDGGDNPAELGLYKIVNDEYVLATEAQVDQGVPYYELEEIEIDLTYTSKEVASSDTFTCEGQVIDHWNTTAYDSGNTIMIGETIKEENTMPRANIVLYAIWNTPRTITYNSYTPYNVNYRANPAGLGLYELVEDEYILTEDGRAQSGKTYYNLETPVIVELNYEEAGVVENIDYLKIARHWSLDCWNTQLDGSGQDYAVGAELKAAEITPTESFELYAQWVSDLSDNTGRI